MSDDERMQWLRDRASLADQLVLDMRKCGELLTAAGVPEHPSVGGGAYTLEHRIAMLAKRRVERWRTTYSCRSCSR